MPNVWVDIDEIGLDEFDDNVLKDELESRDYTVLKSLADHELISELKKDYRTYGFTDKFKKLLEGFFEDVECD